MIERKRCDSVAISELRAFTYPLLHTGKEWYVGFNAFDPVQGKMRRKKIKINSIKTITQRKRYAATLIHKLTQKLESGWNPWIESENSRAYHTFGEVCEKYHQYITKLFDDGIYREETYVGYVSYLRNLQAWNDSRRVPITYIYQFDNFVCSEFLDHVYIDRKNSVQTRNNYLTFLGVFSSFLVQHQYMKTKPCEGLQRIGKSLIKKERTIIDPSDMERLRDYLLEHNKHYLLACYLLHYVLIRPKEISMLKIKDINFPVLSRCPISLPSSPLSFVLILYLCYIIYPVEVPAFHRNIMWHFQEQSIPLPLLDILDLLQTRKYSVLFRFESSHLESAVHHMMSAYTHLTAKRNRLRICPVCYPTEKLR